ncbi:MAG: hypothetical protein AB7F98_08180 [Novosphingobium sp.]
MRYLTVLCLAAPLAACATLLARQDSQAAMLANAIHTEAATFFGVLGGKAAPDCGYGQNSQAYDRLDALSGELQARVGTTHASPMLVEASRALTQAIAHVRESHRLASADLADPAGPCLPPDAIMLNADAIARASAAIATSQTPQ